MASTHRKLMFLQDFNITSQTQFNYSTKPQFNLPDPCSFWCNPSNTISGCCITPCLAKCSEVCSCTLPSLIPPDPPTYYFDHPNKPAKVSSFLIIVAAVVAATFLVISLYAMYLKLGSRRRRQSQRSQPEVNTTHDEVSDEEDQEPMVDHHIWYINTVGLQASVINSIAICKYKRGDGLVEGTECSVCLNEFQEDETLRLLPKCSHAFHIPCIDTWLRSHTNCPMCRAGIVSTAAIAPSPVLLPIIPIIRDSDSPEQTQIGNSENDRELTPREDGEVGDQAPKPIRRSVSVNSIEGSILSLALENGFLRKIYENSKTQLVEMKESGSGKRVLEGQNLVTLEGSTSIERSLQNGQSSMKRSMSCSGKLLSARFSRSRRNSSSLILPL